ncbi:hypothetical protein SLEP1_g44444 [Rubroshorea leprosula]|uniref:Uncharacterized protein n=1 Tax=Rubroshorea leprosula TaxID=152421 RepID=A0AAV5LI36_9ROSI|nr:hypothetical protein SLEP1_g44444 [Rubroshorea leprosula]
MHIYRHQTKVVAKLFHYLPENRLNKGFVCQIYLDLGIAKPRAPTIHPPFSSDSL